MFLRLLFFIFPTFVETIPTAFAVSSGEKFEYYKNIAKPVSDTVVYSVKQFHPLEKLTRFSK